MCQKSAIYQFVEALFTPSKEPVSGIHIRMDDGSIINVSLFENNNTVEVSMNGTIMGHFEPMTERGYKYCFYQKNRKGIKKGYTIAEALMIAICESNSDDILLYKA